MSETDLRLLDSIHECRADVFTAMAKDGQVVHVVPGPPIPLLTFHLLFGNRETDAGPKILEHITCLN